MNLNYQEYTNKDLNHIFHCQIEGGIRSGKYKHKRILIAIFNFFNPSYPDRIEHDTIHICGMGRIGNQDVHHSRNRKLLLSRTQHIPILLFYCLSDSSQSPKLYYYGGQVKLNTNKVYDGSSKDEAGNYRKVIIFSLSFVNQSYRSKVIHHQEYENAKNYRIDNMPFQERSRSNQR